MWRMAIAAVMVACAYLGVPRFAPGAPSPSEADSFGEPWTVESLAASFRADGVALQITDVQGTFDDALPGVREPMLLAEGTLGATPAHLVIYRTDAARKRIWQDAPEGPGVSVRGTVGIPEIYQLGAGNAVLVLLGFNLNQSNYDAVRHEMMALRSR